MTDYEPTRERYRLPLRSDHVKQMVALAPLLRRAPKNPLFLLGAAVVGVAGVMAWRNRDRIATRTAPMIEDAKARGQALMEEARHKGEDILEQARGATEQVVAKATRSRKKSASPVAPVPPADMH
jgi:hypothetical protein